MKKLTLSKWSDKKAEDIVFKIDDTSKTIDQVVKGFNELVNASKEISKVKIEHNFNPDAFK